MVIDEGTMRGNIVGDFENSYLIEAGAGAGKSTLIIDRIVNQVVKQGVELTKIVAITFTKNSGNELEDRLRTKLYELLKSGGYPENSQEHARVKKAIEDLDYMEIGTIDSFCNTILKEHPFETGFLSMGFQLIDELEDELIISKIYRDKIRNLYEYPYYLELEKEVDYAGSSLSIEKWFGIQKQYETSCINSRAILVIDEEVLKDYNFDAFHKHEKDVWDGIISKLRTAKIENFPLNKQKSISKLLYNYSFERSYSDAFSLEDYYVLTNKFVEDVEKNIEKNGVQEMSLSYYMTSKGKTIIEDVDLYPLFVMQGKKKQYYNQICTKLVNAIRNAYIEYKQLNNVMTFEDLLFYTKELLVNNSEIRRHYKDRYQTIYVDEFQDTNPLQTEILFLMMDQNHTNLDWRESNLKRGALCLVGDPKQSIYRFRSADITLYNEIRTRFIQNHQKENSHMERFVSLQWNFRSHKTICDYVNEKFIGKDEGDSSRKRAHFYKKALKPHQTVFEGMVAKGKINENDKNEAISEQKLIEGVYKLPVVSQDEDKIDKIAEKNSDDIAKMIRSMVDECVLIRDLEELRPVQFKDFMIITLRTKNMDIFTSKLDEYGIPMSLSGKKFYYRQYETVNLMELVGFLANPSDNIHFVNVLKNIYHVDLKQLSSQYESPYLSWSVLSKMNIEELERIGLAEIIDELKHIYEYRYEKSDPIQVLEYCIEFLVGIYKATYTEIELEATTGTLINFLEMIKDEEVTNLYDLYRCIEERYVTNPVKREASINRDNVVRIMNLHQVKGLESKIVILALNQTDKKPQNIYALQDRSENRLLLKSGSKGDKRTLYEHQDWKKVKGIDEVNEECEMHRLYYVAATRAINALIISTNKKNDIWSTVCDSESAIADISCVLDDWEIDYRNKQVDKTATIDLKDVHRYNVNQFQENIKKAQAISFYELNPSRLDQVPEKSNDGIKWFKNHEHASDQPIGPNWGTLVHRAFELMIQNIRNEDNNAMTKAASSAIHEFYRDVYQENPNLDDVLLTNSLNQEVINKKLIIESAVEENEVFRQLDLITAVLEPKIIEECRKLLESRFLGKSFKDILMECDYVKTELPFALVVSSNSEDILDQKVIEAVNKTIEKLDNSVCIRESEHKIYVDGIIDLAIKHEDIVYVIDYKTNKRTYDGDDFLDYMTTIYQPQLDLYKVILSKLFIKPLEQVKSHLYLTRLEQFLEL